MDVNLKKEITDLLEKDQIKEALDLLPKYLKKTADLNSAILQSAIYNRLNSAITRNTIDWEKAGVIKNRIIISILNILNVSDNRTANSEKNSIIYSEIDSLKESISKIPNKNNPLLRFLYTQTSFIALLALSSIAFGGGIVFGDTAVFSNYINSENSKHNIDNKDQNNYLTTDSLIQNKIDIYQNRIVQIENELELKIEELSSCMKQIEPTNPNLVIKEGTRYSGGHGDYIHFYNQEGNSYEFSGKVSIYSIAGKATLRDNKISFMGQTVEGNLTLLENGKVLLGQIKTRYSPGSSKSIQDVDLRRQ